MGWHLDGKVSFIAGTHTHVQTADERILPDGTAYITDVGMVGPYDGILGMQKENIIKKFITQLPQKFDVEETGRIQFNGVIVDIDPATGKAYYIERIRHNSDNLIF